MACQCFCHTNSTSFDLFVPVHSYNGVVTTRYVFGERVGQALDVREWTQGQLALFSTVGQSHISQVIAGKKKPRIDIAIALANALDVSLDWLAGRPGNGHPGRGLTALYNANPTWLQLAHRALDEAVYAAYGWPPDLTDLDILTRLLALNRQRAAS